MSAANYSVEWLDRGDYSYRVSFHERNHQGIQYFNHSTLTFDLSPKVITVNQYTYNIDITAGSFGLGTGEGRYGHSKLQGALKN